MSIPPPVATGGGNGPLLSRIREEAARQSFAPHGTFRREGPALFRSQEARDLASLLDLDPAVRGWQCLPLVLEHRGITHVPDFLVTGRDAPVLMDAASPRLHRTPDWCCEAADQMGLRYERHAIEPGLQWRLENARDLLGHAAHVVPLQERLLLLACLDEYGTLPLGVCLHVLRRSPDPVGTVAALILRGVLAADLDGGPLDPGTRISRTDPHRVPGL